MRLDAVYCLTWFRSRIKHFGIVRFCARGETSPAGVFISASPADRMGFDDEDMSSASKQWRGNEARELLQSEVFTACLDALREAYIRQWQIAGTVEAREDAHRYVTLIAKLKDDLESIATTGELERRRLGALSGENHYGNFLTWRKK